MFNKWTCTLQYRLNIYGINEVNFDFIYEASAW